LTLYSREEVITLEISEEEYKCLCKIAEEWNMSLNDVIIVAIGEMLEKNYDMLSMDTRKNIELNHPILPKHSMVEIEVFEEDYKKMLELVASGRYSNIREIVEVAVSRLIEKYKRYLK